MHILLGIAGILGAIGTILWYFSRAKHGADDVIETVERTSGAWRRHNYRDRAERPALETEDDPRAAAAALAVAIVQSRGTVTAEDEARLQEEFQAVMGVEDSAELLSYARWLVKNVVDPNRVTGRVIDLLNKELDDTQKQELLGMLERLSSNDLVQIQAIDHLRTHLA